ncbi:MAG TPA: T9SS type A sorting domain-containing protein, partial [Luteibaculaceae bacterium]|nr:T9SS type A sorting domain-containing protein [Luteibaculaceae bacterium]
GVNGGSALTLRFFDPDEGVMDLWVNAFSNKGKNIEQRLWVSIPSSGTYTLSFSNLEPLFEGYSCAVLYDSIAGEYIDLKEQTSYTFASDGYTGVRFILYLTPIKKGNTLKSLDWASISDAPVCELGNKPSPVSSEKANTCNALTKQRVELGNSVYLDARLTDAGNTLNGEVSASENWMVAWKWQGEIYPSPSIQIYKTGESQAIEVIGYDTERACRAGQLLSVKGIFDEAATGVKIWGGETGIQYQSEERVESITVYGLDGKQIWHNIAPSQRDLISLPNQRGVFIVSLKTVNQTVSSRVYLP